MTNKRNDHSTDIKTFRFGSGQVVPLTDHVIHQIPYLLGLVSFVEHSLTGFDDDGNIKLDPIIDFEHFWIIIDALPFQSLSEVLIRLPQNEDSIKIMMLIDYLGLLPTPYPSLDEIDCVFMFSLYEHHIEKIHYRSVIEIDLFQNMAAHVAFGLIKNEYDQTDDQVISKIRWCTMFIINAHNLFHPHIQYHVQKATDYHAKMFRLSFVHSRCSPSNKRENVESRMSRHVQNHVAESHKHSFNSYDKSESVSLCQGLHESPREDYSNHIYNTVVFWRMIQEISLIDSLTDEIFSTLQVEIWSTFTDNNFDAVFPGICQQDLSSPMAHELHELDDDPIALNILQTIFDQLSVLSRIHRATLKLIPNHIREVENSYKKLIEDRRRILQDPTRHFGRFHPGSRFGSISTVQQIEWMREEVVECEKELIKLRQVERFTDEICCSVLSKLSRFATEEIRRIIHLRSILLKLKSEERIQRTKNRQRVKDLKISYKSRKQHDDLPMSKYPIRKYQSRH